MDLSPLNPPAPDHAYRSRALALAAVFVLLFYVGAVPVILFNLGAANRAASDQEVFHLPVIRQFIEQWPHPDLSDYLSSTTPGYHLAVAAIGRAIGQSLTSLRFIGSLFTAGLLATLAWSVGSRQRFWIAAAACLPVLCSIYFFSSGAYLLPDNAGWWGVLAVLLVALRPKVDGWTYVLGGLALLALVLCRQSHLWAAATLWAAAFVGGTEDASTLAARIRRLCLMFVATAPALLAVLWFRHLWHGALVPPNQVHLTAGGNTAAPALILAIAGCVGACYLTLADRTTRISPPILRIGFFGAIAGFVIGALPQSTYGGRRVSGIWNAVKHAPYVMDRSVLLIALASLGGAVIAIWLAALPRRQRWIWAATGAAFVAAQMASANPWERYSEPLVLIAAALTIPIDAHAARSRWTIAGPVFLSLLLLAVTVASVRH
jgi:hypothetical protein